MTTMLVLHEVDGADRPQCVVLVHDGNTEDRGGASPMNFSTRPPWASIVLRSNSQ